MMAGDGSKATLPLAQYAEHGDLEDGTESTISRVRSRTLLDGSVGQAEKKARVSDIKREASGLKREASDIVRDGSGVKFEASGDPATLLGIEASGTVRDGSGVKREAPGVPATPGIEASGTASIAPAFGVAPKTPAAMPPSTPAGIPHEFPETPAAMSPSTPAGIPHEFPEMTPHVTTAGTTPCSPANQNFV